MEARYLSKTGEGNHIIQVDIELFELITPQPPSMLTTPGGPIRLHEYLSRASQYSIRMRLMKDHLSALIKLITDF